jgi:hypothetical protein
MVYAPCAERARPRGLPRRSARMRMILGLDAGRPADYGIPSESL